MFRQKMYGLVIRKNQEGIKIDREVRHGKRKIFLHVLLQKYFTRINIYTYKTAYNLPSSVIIVAYK